MRTSTNNGLVRMRIDRSRLVRGLMLAGPCAFLGVFFVYPVASIVGRGLTPGGSLDLTPLADVVTDARFRGVAWFTIWQATVSTALTVLVALPGAYVFARFDFRGKRVLRAAVLVPFVLPTVVVGSAFLALLGEGGPLGFLGLDQSVAAILVAHVFFNYAVVVLIVGGLWAHLDPRQEDAARVLGAGRWQTFRSVTLPSLRPAIAAAAAIVFLFDFTSFGVILILGGPGYSTLETEVYRPTVPVPAPAAGGRAVDRADGRGGGRAARRGTRAGPAGGGAAPAGGRRDLAAASHPRRARHGRDQPRRDRRPARRPDRGPRRALVRHRRRLRPRLLPRAVGAPAHEHDLRAAGRCGAQLTRVRRPRPDHRPRHRRVGCVRDRRPPPFAPLRRPRHAAAPAPRRVGGDDRLRLPDRARQAAVRPARVAGAHPHRARAGRGAVRGPGPDPRAAIHRPAPARHRGRPRRVAGTGLARDRPADRGAGAARRGRVRVRHLPPPVRRPHLHPPAPPPHAARGHFRRARPARHAELRRRDGGERHPHGGDRGRDLRHRAFPVRGHRGVLTDAARRRARGALRGSGRARRHRPRRRRR